MMKEDKQRKKGHGREKTNIDSKVAAVSANVTAYSLVVCMHPCIFKLLGMRGTCTGYHAVAECCISTVQNETNNSCDRQNGNMQTHPKLPTSML